MNSTNLDKDTISRPELWRLAIMIGHDALDVALYPPVAREEILWRRFPLDVNSPSPLRAIEDIIYENPLLLSDFRKVDCIIDSTSRLILPPCVPSDDYETLLSSSTLGDTGNEPMIFQATEEVKIIENMTEELSGFIRRTFFNVKFHGRMSLLISYVISHCEGLQPLRAAALIRNNRLTFIAADGKRLLAANDFKYNTAADAAYYILASLQNLGIDPTDQDFDLAINGESLTAPDTVTSLLRSYVTNIRALPFPTLRYRASKTTLQIPFPLLILPICE